MFSLRSLSLMTLLVLGAAPVAAQASSKGVTDDLANGLALAEPSSLLSLPARLDVRNVELSAALTMLRMRSGAPLAFSPSLLPRDHQVSCSCEAVTVASALDRILLGTEFQYTEVGHQILIERRDEEFAPSTTMSPNEIVVAMSTSGARGNGWSVSPLRVARQRAATITGVVV